MDNKQTELIQTYQSAARVLIGAMLREPHMYHSYRIPAVWFQDTAQQDIATGIEDVIKLSTSRTYTPTAVRIQSGVTQAEINDLLSDNTPLDIALELFTPIHEMYVEYLCANCINIGQDARSIQETQKQIRAERLAVREGDISEGKDIMDWAIEKLEGKDPTYPTTPHLNTLIESGALRHYAPGDLVIKAGRPGMGKTQEVLNLYNHFLEKGLPGILFSLEMWKTQLLQRLLSMRTGKNTLANWSLYGEAVKADILEQAAWIKERSPRIECMRNIDDIERACRLQKQREGLKFVIVDYLQLVVTSGKKNSNREQDVGDISRRLKALAMELQVPVFALSQLSREVEKRGGTKRPLLSDLRESGSLEQDADIIEFILRPAYYEQLEPGQESAIILDPITGLQPAEIILAKNRHGALYTAAVQYTPARGFIDPPAQSNFEPELSKVLPVQTEREEKGYIDDLYPVPVQMSMPVTKRNDDDEIPF